MLYWAIIFLVKKIYTQWEEFELPNHQLYAMDEEWGGDIPWAYYCVGSVMPPNRCVAKTMLVDIYYLGPR